MQGFVRFAVAASFLLLLSMPSWAATSLNIDNGGSNFGPADSLTLSVGAVNAGAPVAVDVYLLIELPDGALIFFKSDTNGITPYAATSDPSTWKKLYSNIALPSGLNTGLIPLFSYKFAGSEPSGTYRSLLALTTPGTLNVLTYKEAFFYVGKYRIKDLLGNYAGSWTNQTLGITGNVSAQVADGSPGSLNITVNSSGTTFTVTADLTSNDGIKFSGGSSSFGTVNGTIAANRQINGVITSIPGNMIKPVNFTGAFSGGVLNLNGTVTFVNGSSYLGSVTATRQ